MDYQKKKELFKMFRDRQLSGTALDEFLELVKSGELDEDYDRIMEELEAEDKHQIVLPAVTSKEKVFRELSEDMGHIRVPRQNTRWIVAVASVAAVLLLVFGGYRAFEYQRYVKLTHTFINVNVPVSRVQSLTMQDGTKVVLSPGSHFRYPALFSNNARKVELVQGRAFFEVATDRDRPFIVGSDRLNTTALGTSFVVQNFKNYRFEKVSLYTGKVRVDEVGTRNKPVILSPGEEFERGGLGSKGIVQSFPTSKDPMLKGILVFENDRLDEVLYNVATNYNVKLKFDANEMKPYYISGTFNFEDAKDILHSIAFTHALEIKQVDPKTYVIMKRK